MLPKMIKTSKSALIEKKTCLSTQEFQALSKLPDEFLWFANLKNACTKKAYSKDIREFVQFAGISLPNGFRSVTRGHIIAFRDVLFKRNLSASTIRRKLSALASLFDSLCEQQSVAHNPVDGVLRPKTESHQGRTPAISDQQARSLLDAPSSESLKGLRDRAILATFLYHGLRSNELCRLKIEDIQERRGVLHLRIYGKGSKLRYIPVHPTAMERIAAYLESSRHNTEVKNPLFLPIKNNVSKLLIKHLSTQAIYANVIRRYQKIADISIKGFCTHSLRATAATCALEHNADITKVQEMLGHSDISTTRLYDHRNSRPEDSATRSIVY